MAFFGDMKASVYAVNAETGAQIWKVRVEDHPTARITGAPKLFEGRLYVPVTAAEEGSAMKPKYECCSARGALVALDASTGKQIWKTYTIAEEPRQTGKNSEGAPMWGPSGASIWSAPTIPYKRLPTGPALSRPRKSTMRIS